MKPYAISLLERFEAGETAEQLALCEGIRVERIRTRLAAAAEFVRTRTAKLHLNPEAKRAA
jgi:hypothetical protein